MALKLKSFLTVFTAISLLQFVSSEMAQAQYFQMDLMKGRQQAKASTRWTLFDWMSQKQKISLWDQWLAKNRSANIFEMQLSGSQADFETRIKSDVLDNSTRDSSQRYAADIWIQFLGLRAEWEEQPEVQRSSSAMVNLRLIGSSLQSTHLILRGGIQQFETLTDQRKYQNPFASAALRIYFLSFVGLQGEYRQLFEAQSDEGSIRLGGSRARAGAFLEWGILRVTGQVLSEPYKFVDGGVTTDQTRQGVEYGVQLVL